MNPKHNKKLLTLLAGMGLVPTEMTLAREQSSHPSGSITAVSWLTDLGDMFKWSDAGCMTNSGCSRNNSPRGVSSDFGEENSEFPEFRYEIDAQKVDSIFLSRCGVRMSFGQSERHLSVVFRAPDTQAFSMKNAGSLLSIKSEVEKGCYVEIKLPQSMKDLKIELDRSKVVLDGTQVLKPLDKIEFDLDSSSLDLVGVSLKSNNLNLRAQSSNIHWAVKDFIPRNIAVDLNSSNFSGDLVDHLRDQDSSQICLDVKIKSSHFESKFVFDGKGGAAINFAENSSFSNISILTAQNPDITAEVSSGDFSIKSKNHQYSANYGVIKISGESVFSIKTKSKSSKSNWDIKDFSL